METKEFYYRKDYCRHNIWRGIGFGILGVIGFSLFLLIGGAIIMLLWNWLMPSLFQLSMITFWQAVGLALLARLVFGWSHKRWHCADRKGMWHAHHGGHRFFPHRYWKFYGKKYENCGDYFRSWQYYEKFWEEEGEKAFNDYVKRKSETSENEKGNN
jgi:hypothetical protein